MVALSAAALAVTALIGGLHPLRWLRSGGWPDLSTALSEAGFDPGLEAIASPDLEGGAGTPQHPTEAPISAAL